MLSPDSRTMFWKPTGEMMNNSCEGYKELVSDRFLHISCLSVLFVLLLCPSAVVTPSGSGRTVSLPLGSSSAAISEQPHGKGIDVPCPSSPQNWFGSRVKFTHVKLKLVLYMMANWYKFKNYVINIVGHFVPLSWTFLLVSSLKSFPLYFN